MPNLIATLFPFLLITLPWLNPFALGPSPNAGPLLFSWACALVLVGVSGFGLGRAPGLAPGERLVRVSAAAWLAAAVVSAVLGLLQYFGATAVFGQWVNNTGLGQAFANLGQRNQFATLTNIGLVALLWWAVQIPLPAAQEAPPPESNPSEARPPEDPPVPLAWGLALAAALVLGAGNAASSSRTGLLQLLALVVLAVVWRGWRVPRARQILMAAVFAYGWAALMLPRLMGLNPDAAGILARLQAGDSVCGSRLTLWGNVLYLIEQKPWLGWGWGELDFAHFITLYPASAPRFCDILDNAHNLPLQLAVELGVPVALAFCGALILALWRGKPWRETDPTRQMAWAVLGIILLHSMLEYPLWYGPFQMAFGLGIWMLLRAPGESSEPLNSSKPFRPLAPYLQAWAAMLLLACVGYAAWDYQRISQIYKPPEARQAAYRDNTLEKLGASWLFKGQVNFAGLTTTELTPDNAAQINSLAQEVLHFSPEARVVKRVIKSAQLLGLDAQVQYYRARYEAAFPESYARWLQENADLDSIE